MFSLSFYHSNSLFTCTDTTHIPRDTTPSGWSRRRRALMFLYDGKRQLRIRSQFLTPGVPVGNLRSVVSLKMAPVVLSIIFTRVPEAACFRRNNWMCVFWDNLVTKLNLGSIGRSGNAKPQEKARWSNGTVCACTIYL